MNLLKTNLPFKQHYYGLLQKTKELYGTDNKKLLGIPIDSPIKRYKHLEYTILYHHKVIETYDGITIELKIDEFLYKIEGLGNIFTLSRKKIIKKPSGIFYITITMNDVIKVYKPQASEFKQWHKFFEGLYNIIKELSTAENIQI